MKMRRLRNQESQGGKEIHGKVRSLAFYNKFAIKASFVYVERSNLDLANVCTSKLTRSIMKKNCQQRNEYISQLSDFLDLFLIEVALSCFQQFFWWLNSSINTFNFYLFHEIPCHYGARYIYPSDLQVTIATVWPIKLVLRLENNCKNDINHPIFLSQTCY